MNVNLTYNAPRAKVIIKPILCLTGSLKLERTGIGKVIIIKSVKILKAALKNQMNFLSMQWPGLSRSQNASIGTQVQIAVMIA